MKAFAGTMRAAAGCALATLIGIGCSQVVERKWSGRRLSIEEFARSSSDGNAAPGATGSAAEGRPGDVMDGGGDDFEFDSFDFEVMERPVLWSSRPGRRVIVDSMVGEVNGKPIFADAFFEPIEDRLLGTADEYDGPQRDAMIRGIVNSWLREVVLDALLLGEAEASLSTQEKMGLFAFIDAIQAEEIRLGGGTRSGAEDRRRETGEDLDQYLGRQKDLVLLQQIQMRKIDPRVIVSWRDIEREYQRRYDEFNPEATVTLARIRLRTEPQAELIEDIKQRLAGGEPFAEVAEDLGFEDGGVWQTFVIGKGGISDLNVNEEMKVALEGLEEGDTSPPFTLGSVTVWLNVASLNRPRTYTIYDPMVQRVLKNAIRARRGQEEWNRYIESLLERGIYNELDEMSERLYEIAIDRYAR